MTDDELELAILERYLAHHESVLVSGSEVPDKCALELDMREVLAELTRRKGAELEYHAGRWHARLAPTPFAGGKAGPLKPCSNGQVRQVEHRFHARALSTATWERIRELKKEVRVAGRPADENMSTGSIRLFISHASDDKVLAERLIDLFRAALNLPASAIRCTSVNGYRLPAGADTDAQLRQEVHETDAFIGIVSAASIRSLYVLFELGARWGARRPLFPLLAPGTPASVLGRPLNGLNALEAGDAGQIHQLVTDVARELGLSVESPAVFQKHVDAVISTRPVAPTQVAATVGISHPERALLEEVTTLSKEAVELLVEAAKGDGIIMVLETMGGDSVSTNSRDFGERGNSRSEARWRGAARELHRRQYIEDRAGKGEVFFMTDRGFEVAEAVPRLTKGSEDVLGSGA